MTTSNSTATQQRNISTETLLETNLARIRALANVIAIVGDESNAAAQPADATMPHLAQQVEDLAQECESVIETWRSGLGDGTQPGAETPRPGDTILDTDSPEDGIADDEVEPPPKNQNHFIGHDRQTTLINVEDTLKVLAMLRHDCTDEDTECGLSCILSGLRDALKFERWRDVAVKQNEPERGGLPA